MKVILFSDVHALVKTYLSFMGAPLKMNAVNSGAKGQRVIPQRLCGILKGAPAGKTFKEEMSAYKREEIALEEMKYFRIFGDLNSNLLKKKRSFGKGEL